MRWGEFARGLFKKEPAVEPKKSVPETVGKKEKPIAKLREGENLIHFAKRAKEAYGRKGREFDYGKVLLEAVGKRTKEQVVEKKDEAWHEKIKNLLTERTDKGVLVQTCALYGLGAAAAIGSHYLPRELGTLAPYIFAIGGERYLRGMMKAAVYLGEDWLMRSIDSARAGLRKEIKRVFKKGSAESVEKGLELIKQRDSEFRKAKKRKEQLEPWLKGFEFALPKLTMAAAVTGLIPNTRPIPIPLGFQDYDGRALPAEQFNAVYQNLKTGTLHFATDVTAGIGRFGKFLVDQSDVIPKTFQGVGEQTLYATAALGVGAGLVGKEVARGVAAIPEGVSATAKIFYNHAGRLVEAAEVGVDRLARLLKRPVMPRDFDKHPAEKASKPVRHRAPRAEGKRGTPPTRGEAPSRLTPVKEPADFNSVLQKALAEGQAWGREDSPEAKALIAELKRREEEREEMAKALMEWETESPAFVQEKEREQSEETTTPRLPQPFIPTRPALPPRKSVLGIPEITGTKEPIAPEPTPISWRAKPETVRASILANFGITVPEGRGGAYQQFKDALRAFVAHADRDHLAGLKDFLQENDRQLNGTKNQKPVLMWVDRRQLLKRIDSRLQELGVPEPVREPEIPGEPTVPGEPAVPPRPETPERIEPGFTLEDLLKEAEEKEKETKASRALQGGRKMLAALYSRRVPTEVLRLVREGKLNPDGDMPFPGRDTVRLIDSLGEWDKRKIGNTLLYEINALVQAAEKRDKPILDPRERKAYHDVWSDISTGKEWTLIRKGLVKVSKDDAHGWMYRGSLMAPLDPGGIAVRARLNITLSEHAIHALDELAARSAFFYRIGKPGSENDPARMNTTVTVYFPGDRPSRNVLEKLGAIAQTHRRGLGEDLPGNKFNNHLYVSEEFVGQIPRNQKDRFMENLEQHDLELFGIVRKFIGRSGISEEEFHAIKKMLSAFGIPIEYKKEEGVVFLQSKKTSQAA